MNVITSAMQLIIRWCLYGPLRCRCGATATLSAEEEPDLAGSSSAEWRNGTAGCTHADFVLVGINEDEDGEIESDTDLYEGG